MNARVDSPKPPELLYRSEVAALFGVTPATVSAWAEKGLLPCVKTLGGQRRYPRAAVEDLLQNGAPKS